MQLNGGWTKNLKIRLILPHFVLVCCIVSVYIYLLPYFFSWLLCGFSKGKASRNSFEHFTFLPQGDNHRHMFTHLNKYVLLS